jgi:hypothetical protein
MGSRISTSDKSSAGQTPLADRQGPESARLVESIGGGQASICARVAGAAKEAIAHLAALRPMGADPDFKAIEELKSWIRGEFMELVGELSFSDGPSVLRVEEVFSMLLDQMGTLQDLMEDEEGVTSFPALADQMAALYRSWNNMQQLFETQIGIVSKQLSLVTEAIENVRLTMDAASVGPEARRVMVLSFETAGLDYPSTPMDALLAAIQSFASDIAPRAISAGGGFALHNRVAPTAVEWCDLVRACLNEENSGGNRADIFTPQVTRSLSVLAGRLDEVAWNC